MCGSGFRRLIDSRASAVGFYVTRFVKAAESGAAGTSAVEQVTAHLRSDGSFTERSTVDIDSIEAISEDGMLSVQPGFAWFREDA